jgi:hypothetical protein
MLLVGAALALGALLYATSSRVLVRRPGARAGFSEWAHAMAARQGYQSLGVETLATAERLHAEGAYRQVVVQASMAVDLLIEEISGPNGHAADDERTELYELRTAALDHDATISPDEALKALIVARNVMTRLVGE